MTGSGTAVARIISQDQHTATVQALGEIDTSTSPALRSCLEECLYQGCTQLTVDVSRLEFIDSSGIQVLLWLLKELRTLDGQLIVRDPPTMAERVLGISGLTPYLSITRNAKKSPSRRRIRPRSRSDQSGH